MTESIDNKEQKKKLERGELAPVEEHFTGSTTNIEGRYINVPLLLPEARKGVKEAMISLFTPVLSQCEGADENDKKLVLSRRQASRDDKRIKGSITILDPIGTVGLFKKGLNVCLELSDLDEEGLVKRNWKIYLVDNIGNIVSNKEALNSQKINSARLSDFNLGEIQEEERENGPLLYRTLTLQS